MKPKWIYKSYRCKCGAGGAREVKACCTHCAAPSDSEDRVGGRTSQKPYQCRKVAHVAAKSWVYARGGVPEIRSLNHNTYSRDLSAR